jgi:hypothetical protein
MENPYLGEGQIGRRDTRPIMGPWQREKSVKIMNSLTAARYRQGGGAVDKHATRPYLCHHRVNGDSAYFAAFLAVAPWIA